MPNCFAVVFQTRPFKIVGFEDIYKKNKERVEKKYPLSIVWLFKKFSFWLS